MNTFIKPESTVIPETCHNDIMATYLTPKQASQILHMNLNSLYIRLRNFEIPFIQVSAKRILISMADLNQYLEERRISSMQERMKENEEKN